MCYHLNEVIAAIGPLWSWHEVWLVGFGGTLVAVFPRLMASAFAGYYLALFLILWCLILRGIALEVGGHIHDRLWQWTLAVAQSQAQIKPHWFKLKQSLPPTIPRWLLLPFFPIWAGLRPSRMGWINSIP